MIDQTRSRWLSGPPGRRVNVRDVIDMWLCGIPRSTGSRIGNAMRFYGGVGEALEPVEIT